MSALLGGQRPIPIASISAAKYARSFWGSRLLLCDTRLLDVNEAVVLDCKLELVVSCIRMWTSLRFSALCHLTKQTVNRSV